jgi:hypothetical protein
MKCFEQLRAINLKTDCACAIKESFRELEKNSLAWKATAAGNHGIV